MIRTAKLSAPLAGNALGLLLAAGVLMCCVAQAQTQSRLVVVELFTSQGCSSCPPADAYIGELAEHKDVLALSFHVDYWDDLGWKDRFSLGISTERQRVYSAARGRSSVYTPQVVIDGKDDFVGTDRRNISQALTMARSGAPVGILLQEGDVVVDLGAQAQIARRHFENCGCAAARCPARTQRKAAVAVHRRAGTGGGKCLPEMDRRRCG